MVTALLTTKLTIPPVRPLLHDALTFLLEHLPPPERGLHLVIATRIARKLGVQMVRSCHQLFCGRMALSVAFRQGRKRRAVGKTCS